MSKPGPMTLLDPKTIVRRGNRRGGREIVYAESAERVDGQPVWMYIRGEEAGTPWHLLHGPTQRALEFAAPSLPSARRITASGWALDELDRRDAARAAAEQAQEVAA